MAQRKRSQKRVTWVDLSCTCSFMPGAEWRATASVVVEDGHAVIRQGGDCDEEDHATVPLIDEPWRELARYLAHQDELWALPEGAGRSIYVSSGPGDLEPWQEDLLSICWCHAGEEKEWSPGAVLIDLPEAWISGILARYGPFSAVLDDWDGHPLIVHLRWLRNIASELDIVPVTLLLRASHRLGIGDDPRGFRLALADVLREHHDVGRGTRGMW